MTDMATLQQLSSATSNSSQNNSTLPGFAQNASSLANSIFFLVVYSILIIVVAVFYGRGRSAMKKNQQILLLLVSIFILIQYFGLLARTVYNGVGLYLNGLQEVEVKDNYDPIFGYRVTLWVFGTIENILVFSQLISIFVIMCFIQNMFLKTVLLAGAMTKKAFKILKYFVNIITIIFCIVAAILILLNNIFNLYTRIRTQDKINIIPLILCLFFITLFMLIVQTVMFLGIGIKLIVLVRSHSLSITQMKKINNSALKNVLQKPYAKIVGLLIGMTSSAWIQLVAGVVSALTSLFASDLHMIDYFLQCFGILIFAIFVLLLFNPLLEESNHSSATMVTTERDDQEGNEDSISKQQSTLSQSHHPPFSKEMLSLPESSSSPSIAMNTSPSSPNDLEMNEIAKV